MAVRDGPYFASMYLGFHATMIQRMVKAIGPPLNLKICHNKRQTVIKIQFFALE